MAKKKLLILLKSVDGGTGTYLEGLLRLREKGYKIRVLGLEKPVYRDVTKSEYVFFSDERYIPHRYSLKFVNVKNMWLEYRWLESEVAAFSPDLLIAQDPHAIVLAGMLKLLHRDLRVAGSIHNNFRKVVDRRLGGWGKSIFVSVFGFLIRRADVVVTVSQALARDVREDLRLNVMPTVISNILPISHEMRRAKKGNATIIVSVSRMDNQKDQALLIRAFTKLALKNHQLTLWLVGDGPQKEKLEIMARKADLDERVIFWGWHQHPLALMAKADLFVLPTHWEGFPLSLIEAMRLGLPVIATDCDYGPREILGDGKHGLLVAENDEIALTQAMEKLVSDTELLREMGRRAALRAGGFSDKKMLGMYEDLISRLIQGD